MAHRERVLFPEVGLTGVDLARYYAQVAGAMVPHLKDRALTLRRWPIGLGGGCFYQRHLAGRTGSPEGRVPIRIDTVDDLGRWAAQGIVEVHAPLGRLSLAGRHDWTVVDLDPHPPADFGQAVAVGEAVAALLAKLGMPYSLKTSGGRGLHLYIPVQPVGADAALAQAERLARLIRLTWPNATTLTRTVGRRGGRVYIDYLQNAGNRTMAAPFSVRGLPEAPVSWPTAWPDIRGRTVPGFTVPTVGSGPVPTFARPPAVDIGECLDRAGIPPLSELRRGF